jgi:hypothetical protein
MFSDRLARIFHLDGQLPTEAADGPMINLALTQLGKALGASGNIHTWEYMHELHRIRHQFMRNNWLGRSRHIGMRLAVKAVFRALRSLHG